MPNLASQLFNLHDTYKKHVGCKCKKCQAIKPLLMKPQGKDRNIKLK